jgi:hypothetical protein
MNYVGPLKLSPCTTGGLSIPLQDAEGASFSREGGGGPFSLSMCVCVIEKGGGEFECILQLLASQCRTYLSQCARTKKDLEI